MATVATNLSGKRILLAMLGILLFAVVPAIILPNLVCSDPRARELKDIGTVAPFSLVDERGDVFTHEGFIGHPTIVSFIFTRCDTVCPVTAMKMAKIENKLRDKRGHVVKLVSFSVDPEYDTPERLAAFGARYQANSARWKFLTGKPADIKAVIEGSFMSPLDREGTTSSGAPNIVHAGYFMLVDGNLTIRGIYDSNDKHELDAMLHDARYLARTQRSGYKFGGG